MADIPDDGWLDNVARQRRERTAQIEAMVAEVMDDTWADFVMDTGNYPDDFTVERKSLHFRAGRWAHIVGQEVARRLAGNAGVTGTRPSKEWYAEKIADTQQAEDAAGGVLAAGALGVPVVGDAQPRNVTAQEDKWLRDAAKRASKVVAPGKLANGVALPDGGQQK